MLTDDDQGPGATIREKNDLTCLALRRRTRQAQVRPRLESAVGSSRLGSPAQLARLVLATSERTVVVAADQPGGNDGGWALSRHSGGAAVRP